MDNIIEQSKKEILIEAFKVTLAKATREEIVITTSINGTRERIFLLGGVGDFRLRDDTITYKNLSALLSSKNGTISSVYIELATLVDKRILSLYNEAEQRTIKELKEIIDADISS